MSDDADFDRWADEVRDHLIPRMRTSAAIGVMAGDLDVKMAVELGMSIMLDKPLILIVLPGRTVPERLVRAADAILDWDGQSPDIAARVYAAIAAVTGGEAA